MLKSSSPGNHIEDVELPGIPDGYYCGQALGQGDCFFDAVKQGLQQLRPHLDISVKSLRHICKSYAQEVKCNNDDIKCDTHTWLKKALENDFYTLKDYIHRIAFTGDDIDNEVNEIKSLGLTTPLWGRPEIEGRIICEIYDVELHVVELHCLEGDAIPVHQIIRKNYVKTDETFSLNNCVHIMNRGDYHFFPLLLKVFESNDEAIINNFTRSTTKSKGLTISTDNSKHNRIGESQIRTDEIFIFGFFNEYDLEFLIQDQVTVKCLSRTHSHKAFNVSGSSLFFINCKIPILKTFLDNFSVERLNTLNRPFIIQWGSKIWIKEKVSEMAGVLLDLKNDSSKMDESNFIDELDKGVFGMILLMNGIISGAIGRFKTNLLDVELDNKKHFLTWKLIDYAMFNDDILVASYLMLFDWNLTECNEEGYRPLELAAKYASASTLSILLRVSPTDSEKVVGRNVSTALKQADGSGKTPLMIACEQGKAENVDLFLCCYGDTIDGSVGSPVLNSNKCLMPIDQMNLKALDLAWLNSQYDVVLVMLEADLSFPTEFKYEHLVSAGKRADKLKQLVDERIKLHELIQKEDNVDEIKNVIKKFKSKILLNCNNESLLLTAMKKDQYKAFGYLKSEGFQFKDKEEKGNYQELSWIKKSSIKIILPNYYPRNNSHITHLVAKSQFSTKEHDPEKEFKLWYERLDTISELSCILRVIECAGQVTIIFDSNNEATDELNPTTGDTTKGCCEAKSGKIYIGAKVRDSDFYGTLIHELTHFALTILYKNKANPYSSADEVKKEEFNSIIENLKDKEDVDEIIKRVWKSYDQDLWPAELIVRVPHMIAKYGNDEGQFLLGQQAPALLHFYEKNVMLECKQFLKDSTNIVEINSIQSANLSSGTFTQLVESEICLTEPIGLQEFLTKSLDKRPKVLILNTKNTFISMLNIFQGLEIKSKNFPRGKCLFISFDYFIQEREETLQNFCLHMCKVFIIEIPLVSLNITMLPDFLEQLREIFKRFGGKRVILVVDESKTNFVKDNIFEAGLNDVCTFTTDKAFTLADLSLQSQKKFMSKKLYFQSEVVILDQIVKEESKQIIDSETLVKLANNEEFINIGGNLPVSKDWNDGCYLNRCFYRNLEIKKTILQNEKIYIAISGCSNEVLENLGTKSVNFFEGTSNNLVCLDECQAEKQFQHLCKDSNKHCYHWLRFQDDKFIWQQSDGLVSEIEPYIDSGGNQCNHSEEGFLKQSYIDKLVVISSEPGAGKSTVCTKLAKTMKKIDPTWMVLRINLNDHSDQLFAEEHNRAQGKPRFHPDDEDNMRITDFLLTLLNAVGQFLTNFEKSLFRRLFNLNRVAILLDGFDEICPHYKDIILDLLMMLRTRINHLFITTRPNVSSFLQDRFKVFAYKLQQLSEEEQIDCLYRKLELSLRSREGFNQERVLKYTHFLINKVSCSGVSLDMEYTSIPLILKLLSVNFKDECLKFCESDVKEPTFPEKKMTLTTLIDGFVEKIFYELYQEDKNLIQLSITRNRILFGHEFEKFVVKHERLAVYSLFREDERVIILTQIEIEEARSWIQRMKSDDESIGIITEIVNDNPHFLHRVFQEYFVGKLIVKRLKAGKLQPQEPEFMLTNIFIKYEFFVVRKFMDGELSNIISVDTSPREYLPEDVLETYGKSLSDVWSRDKYLLCTTYENRQKTILHVGVDDKNIFILMFIIGCLGMHPNSAIINALDKYSDTATHYAASYGSLEMVKILVQFGKADINKVNSYGYTVMNRAKKYTDVIKWLIQFGSLNDSYGEVCLTINPYSTTRLYTKMTTINMYSFLGNLEIVQLIVSCKISKVNDADSYGMTPLHWAGIGGRGDVVNWLIDNGADPNALDRHKCNPLFVAIDAGGLDAVIALIQKTNADINAIQCQNLGPAHWAARAGKVNVLEWLLNNGYDIDQHTGNWPQVTVLQHAGVHGQLKVIQWLTESRGFEALNPANNLGKLTLRRFFAGGKINVLEWLLETVHNKIGDIFHATDTSGNPLLHATAYHNSWEALKWFVGQGADINAQDCMGETVLIIATGRRQWFIIEWMLQNGADVNIPNKFGIYPLHEALKNSNEEIAVMFVNHGSELNLETTDLIPLIYIAASKGFWNLVETMILHGANVLARNCHHSLLHKAVSGRNHDAVRKILNKVKDQCGPDLDLYYKSINIKDEEGDTPFMWAAKMNSVDVGNTLIEHGIDINAKNNNGQTALHWVCKNGHVEFLKFLIKNNAAINVRDKNGKTPHNIASSKAVLDLLNQENYLEIAALVRPMSNCDITG